MFQGLCEEENILRNGGFICENFFYRQDKKELIIVFGCLEVFDKCGFGEK